MEDNSGIRNKTSNSTQYVKSGGRLRYEIGNSDSWDCTLHKMSHQQGFWVLRKSTHDLIKQKNV